MELRMPRNLYRSRVMASTPSRYFYFYWISNAQEKSRHSVRRCLDYPQELHRVKQYKRQHLELAKRQCFAFRRTTPEPTNVSDPEAMLLIDCCPLEVYGHAMLLHYSPKGINRFCTPQARDKANIRVLSDFFDNIPANEWQNTGSCLGQLVSG